MKTVSLFWLCMFQLAFISFKSYAQPDLIVADMQISEDSVVRGEGFRYSCRVRNIGDVASPGNNFGLFLSKDTVYDKDDSAISGFYVSSIEPGDYFYLNLTTNIREVSEPGSYFILFQADYQRTVPEPNEVNNTSYLPFQVLEKDIEFEIDGLNPIPGDLVPGNELDVNFRMSNLGSASSDSVSVAFYLSEDSELDTTEDLFVQTLVFDPIRGYGYRGHRESININGELTLGSYFLFAIIDSQDEIEEKNESNNVSVAPFSLSESSYQAEAKMSISGGSTLYLGQTSARVRVDVTNLGNEYGFGAVNNIYLSVDATLDNEDILLGNNSFNFFSPKPNETSRSQADVYFPLSLSEGKYFLIAQIEMSSVDPFEVKETVYPSMEIEFVVKHPDLVIYDVEVQEAASAGSTVHCLYSVHNSGAMQTGTEFNVSHYLSEDGTFNSASEVLLESETVSALEPGEYEKLDVSLVLPNSLTTGEYTLFIVVDEDDEILESSEENNIKSTVIKVPQPGEVDLNFALSNLTKREVLAGEAFDFIATIRNSGNNTSSSSSVKYYLSEDDTYDFIDTYLELGFISSLSGGETEIVSETIELASFVTEGDYFIIAVIDEGETLDEFDETNNSSAIPLTVVSPTGDFELKDLKTYTSQFTVGTSFEFLIQFRNNGNINEPANIGFYLSEDSLFSELDDTLIGSKKYETERNKEYSTESSFILSNDIGPGDYYLFTKIDYLNEWFEIDEENNTLRSEISISPISEGMDLIVMPETPLLFYIKGQGLNLDVTLRSIGETKVQDSTDIALFLSEDAVWDASDVLLEEDRLSAEFFITSNPQKSFSISRHNLNVGKHYLIAVADHGNLVDEINEENNVSVTELFVFHDRHELNLAGVTFSSQPAEHQGVIFYEAVLQNFGPSFLTPFTISIFHSVDEVFDNSDSLVGIRSISTTSISRDGTSFSGSFELPEEYESNHYLIFVVDIERRLNEKDFSNNIYGAGETEYVFVSVSEFNSVAKRELKLFPIPADNEVMITSKVMGYQNVEIYSMDGVGRQLEIQNTSEFPTVNTTELSDGMYLLKITDEAGEIHSAKFLVTH